MSYSDFTEMPVWQKANAIVEGVYKLCTVLPRSEEYALSSQLKRAAISLTANIAEAFGRNHSKDKINFYFFARGSAFELRSHLIVGRNIGFFINEQIEQINADCLDVVQTLNKIIKGLTNTSGLPKSQPNPQT